MKDLRERCEKLATTILLPADQKLYLHYLEAFALQIRNETLEDAASYVDARPYGYKAFGDDIRALKTPALDASGDE